MSAPNSALLPRRVLSRLLPLPHNTWQRGLTARRLFAARTAAERLIHDRYPQVTPRQHQKHQKDSTFGESKPRGSAVITRYRVPGGSGVDPGLMEGPAGDLSQYKVGHK